MNRVFIDTSFFFPLVNSKGFSYVDATSFAIMERLEITQCLT